MSGYIGSLSPDYVCPLKCMYFFLCFYYSVYMLPITLSYFWYQSWVLCWVPNGSNVFGFLLGWLLGLFAVFSLFGLIRMIFSFKFSLLSPGSLSHSLPYVAPLSLSCVGYSSMGCIPMYAYVLLRAYTTCVRVVYIYFVPSYI